MCSLFGLPPKKRQHISAERKPSFSFKTAERTQRKQPSSSFLFQEGLLRLGLAQGTGGFCSTAEEPWPDAPGKQGFHPMSSLSLKKKKNLCKKALGFFRNKVVKSPFLPPWSPGQQPCPVPLLASSVLAKAKETLNGPFKRQHDREGNERWLVLLFWGIFFLRYNSILT